MDGERLFRGPTNARGLSLGLCFPYGRGFFGNSINYILTGKSQAALCFALQISILSMEVEEEEEEGVQHSGGEDEEAEEGEKAININRHASSGHLFA